MTETYAPRRLALIGDAGGFRQYGYTADCHLDVLSPGFFDPAFHLERGDQITISSPTGGAIRFVTAESGHVILRIPA